MTAGELLQYFWHICHNSKPT